MWRGIIFDFDGVILDTEFPYFKAWDETFATYGCELPLELWSRTIGTQDALDPHGELERQLGREVDRELIRRKRHARFEELMLQKSIAAGVDSYLDEASRLGLATGISSSSSRDWVIGFLNRFGLTKRFRSITCWDSGLQAKPAPDLYHAVLKDLELLPDDVIAIEDSPNGIAAAKSAGLFCLAVPCEMTRQLDLTKADLIVESLVDLPLVELLALATRTRQGSSS